MNQKCDIYMPVPSLVPELKYVHVLDRGFCYNPLKEYAGYVGVELPRLRAVAIVSKIRSRGIPALNVPLRYKTGIISLERGREVASEYAKSMRFGASSGNGPMDRHTPLYWCFSVTSMEEDDRAGGRILVDRCDGHVWSTEELDDYMYDYNNVLD